MPKYLICLLLAIGAASAIPTNGARSEVGADVDVQADADVRADPFEMWNANKPLSRAKREPFLGPVGTVLGFIFQVKVKVLTFLFNLLDTPLRWIQNQFADWSNYYNDQTRGNLDSPWGLLG